jgi:hypothetical protein
MRGAAENRAWLYMFSERHRSTVASNGGIAGIGLQNLGLASGWLRRDERARSKYLNGCHLMAEDDRLGAMVNPDDPFNGRSDLRYIA